MVAFEGIGVLGLEAQGVELQVSVDVAVAQADVAGLALHLVGDGLLGGLPALGDVEALVG